MCPLPPSWYEFCHHPSPWKPKYSSWIDSFICLVTALSMTRAKKNYNPVFLTRMVSTHSVIKHYSGVIMGAMASQITSLTIVYSTVYSGADQRQHQSSALLAFVREFTGHRWIPRTNGQWRGKCFHLCRHHDEYGDESCAADIHGNSYTGWWESIDWHLHWANGLHKYYMMYIDATEADYWMLNLQKQSSFKVKYTMGCIIWWQLAALLALMRGIQWSPVNSPHKCRETR